MAKPLKIITTLILSIVVLVIVYFLIWSAVQSFDRFDFELNDREYKANDSDISVYLRGDYAIVFTGDEGITYAMEVADRNLLKLTYGDTVEYVLLLEKGETIYLKSSRTYLYLSEAQKNE